MAHDPPQEQQQQLFIRLFLCIASQHPPGSASDRRDKASQSRNTVGVGRCIVVGGQTNARERDDNNNSNKTVSLWITFFCSSALRGHGRRCRRHYHRFFITTMLLFSFCCHYYYYHCGDFPSPFLLVGIRNADAPQHATRNLIFLATPSLLLSAEQPQKNRLIVVYYPWLAAILLWYM